jgi:D-alanyl-lipoteichoic acid acyltransferase DltB (MBOAT superfamily)
MGFVSVWFLLFCAAAVLLYYVLPKKWQWPLLLIASCAFYASYDLRYFGFIAVTTVSVYFAACKISQLRAKQNAYLNEHLELGKDEKKAYKAKTKKKTWAWLITCLLLNFGILFALKYINFFIGNINAIISIFSESKIPTFDKLLLPLGISYYTFKTAGYIIDVYFGRYEAEKNVFKVALFTSFFPTLLNGPIDRFPLTAPSLFGEHSWGEKRARFALQRILWGYFKKVVIADRLVVAVIAIVSDPEKYPGVMVAFGALLYAAELYCDFTGGIDITIGVANLFGVEVSENFLRPFFSKNIAEYWRRWHITLGTWFKDYTFYPLCTAKPVMKLTKFAKNKFGAGAAKRVPIYVASIVLWFCTGAWHGASWNFILWGMGNCFVILVSQELTPLYKRFHAKHPDIDGKWYYKTMCIVRTNAIMCCLRLFDCYKDVPTTFKAFGSMFTKPSFNMLNGNTLLNLGLTAADYAIAFAGILLIFAVSMIQRRGSVREMIDKKGFAFRLALFALLFAVIIVFGAYGLGYDSNSFIYSKF